MGVREWPILEINVSIIGSDNRVVRYGFVGLVYSRSIVMTMNLFFHVHFMYYAH